jgi:hypothetical protein
MILNITAEYSLTTRATFTDLMYLIHLNSNAGNNSSNWGTDYMALKSATLNITN